MGNSTAVRVVLDSNVLVVAARATAEALKKLKK